MDDPICSSQFLTRSIAFLLSFIGFNSANISLEPFVVIGRFALILDFFMFPKDRFKYSLVQQLVYRSPIARPQVDKLVVEISISDLESKAPNRNCLDLIMCSLSLTCCIFGFIYFKFTYYLQRLLHICRTEKHALAIPKNEIR